MKRGRHILAISALALALWSPFPGRAAIYKQGDCPYKVYVILGFHANFYHSWRGDTPDEAGFGQDIRIVREIIRMLDEANEKGLDARGYWEGESLFTFEDIVPNYAPDINEDIKRRIDEGHDEFMPAPYSNTLFGAVTEDEMRAVVRWSLTNPWGSGAKDLFGGYVPFIRPQEGMVTTGQIPILKEEGIDGLTLAYSTYSFTTFSNFIQPMPPEQRYHFTTLRMQDSGEEMLLFPCVSAADVVNYISLEKWMLDLRKLQTSGKVNQDMVIHINFDADADTWLPLAPKGLRWIPNTGGLPEYIKAVNKYKWSEFALPSDYIANHEPVGEVLFRQDTADGGWDGYYSWSEKYPSHKIWTELEKSRLYTYRAESMAGGLSCCGGCDKKGCQKDKSDNGGLAKTVSELLYKGRDSSFFHRLRGLSTTHYGMSTPMVNEERQSVAEKVADDARDRAEEAERMLADRAAEENKSKASKDALYSFLVTGVAGESGDGRAVDQLVRIPLILERDVPPLLLEIGGKRSDFSLINLEEIDDENVSAELVVPLTAAPGETLRVDLVPSEQGDSLAGKTASNVLENGAVELRLSEADGVESLSFQGDLVGGNDFLDPFITYKAGKKPETFNAGRFRLEPAGKEIWNGLERARIAAAIPFDTPHGVKEAEVTVTFTLPDKKDWLVADVEVGYPYTVKEDIIMNTTQKLRRYLDTRWIEVAPFQLHPRLEATRSEPIKVWKHNYLGVTSWYELNYGQINPDNAEIDGFNHQVTAGWVAVSDGKRGMLVGQNAEVASVFAFCPMRLRERGAREQELWLNPFGSYYGNQLSYSHLGGVGLGSDIANAASAALRPNGPSYNGVTERFSLLLAPYRGDGPGEGLQAEAHSFFYPAEVVYVKSPEGIEARLRQDIVRLAREARVREARKASGPLPKPLAFLANPTEEAVDLVWDEPADPRIDNYVVQWKEKDAADWSEAVIDPANRYRVSELDNGASYSFRAKTRGMGNEGPWTETLTVEVGPVEQPGIMSNVSNIQLSTLLKTVYYINVHLLTTPP